jgi:hypothetical protein
MGHAALMIARCMPPGVHEKQRFSFAHQNAERSGDADKQAVTCSFSAFSDRPALRIHSIEGQGGGKDVYPFSELTNTVPVSAGRVG